MSLPLTFRLARASLTEVGKWSTSSSLCTTKVGLLGGRQGKSYLLNLSPDEIKLTSGGGLENYKPKTQGVLTLSILPFYLQI